MNEKPGDPGMDPDRSDGEPAPPGSIAKRIAAEFERLDAERLRPGLYVVATPIGNLGDMTVRGLSILSRADEVRCEDTRHTRVLLARYGIRRKLETYHEHNAQRERPRILDALSLGRSVALVSDAGTPLVSDPGLKLVRAVLDRGFPVTAAPGASAVLAAVSIAGLPTDAFHFAGFLPVKSAQRQIALQELSRLPATLVLFEAPQRLAAMLTDAVAVLGNREAAILREATKLHEELVRGTLTELANWASTGVVKGEFVVMIRSGSAEEVSDARIIDELEKALMSESLRDAARSIAEELGVSRGRVYELGVAWKKGIT